jgi:phosphatidylethanolamine/phosphatidyl-N-methylethanolamine N-methyltransferase
MKPGTLLIKKRFDRIAPFFDSMDAVCEGLFLKHRRRSLWSLAAGPHILEVGVGTGKNFDYYPASSRITAIDFSPQMLKRAEQKKRRKNIDVELMLMDVQSLCYADNSFDTIIASCVFCSVPSPHKGLKELYRVCRPGGRVLLLEHVISARPLLAALMNFFNPVPLKLMGVNINRDTLTSIRACGFSGVALKDGSNDIIKLIEARK